MLSEPVTGIKPAKTTAPLPRQEGVVEKRTPLPGTQGGRARGKPDAATLTRVAGDAQKALDIIHSVGLKFIVHRDTGQVIIKVVDESTGKVIREIPPSEVLDLATKLDKMVGLIFDIRG